MSSAAASVTLTEDDIPGAKLSKPYNKHTVPELSWWLLCRGIQVPKSWKKRQVVDRVLLAEQDQANIVDVDGSYAYRKYFSMQEAGINVDLPPAPSSPLAGWSAVTETTYKDLAPQIPHVTSGLVYTYLAGHLGRTGEEGAFRALSRGYTHWASGRLQELKVNTNNPMFCHVQGTMAPSMKTGTYKVYLLLGREGDFATVCSARCDCAAGMSSSCTHVSAVLHALAALNSRSFRLNPELPSSSDPEEEAIPVTSLPCQWRAPRARKDSSLPISSIQFEKPDYRKPNKRLIKTLEDFDPRPLEFRGTIGERIPAFLEKVRGEELGISFLLDGTLQQTHSQQTAVISEEQTTLATTIDAFIGSLKVSADKAREIERNTRDQRLSPLWFSVRHCRLTASLFGSVYKRRPTTPPDNLVLSIIRQRRFSSEAIQYGIDNEPVALGEYVSYQQSHGHPSLSVAPSGFFVSHIHPFLGATPDGAVYDPSDIANPFGFLEIKCPFTARNVLPSEACDDSTFCCTFDSRTNAPTLKRSHNYYCQTQGQMAIGERSWCDFVVYTKKGIHVERIKFDEAFWKDDLLPKLKSFYHDCVAPELVSPRHALGLPMRDLSKK